MATRARLIEADQAGIEIAATYLKEGKLVAFPTETVYGLGANATDDKAVASIYAAKGRPQINPLIVHVHDVGALDGLVVWTETARLLAAQFWPGPLTLVMERTKTCPISSLASAGLETLAVRIPKHPVARQLLACTGLPIAGPSANRSGRLSPTTPLHVIESLGEEIDLVLAGGKSEVGLESTIVDAISSPQRILRPGAITEEDLEKLLGPLGVEPNKGMAQASILSPGQLPSHYAPHLPLRMNVTEPSEGEAFLMFGPSLRKSGNEQALNLSETGDLTEAAANLFSMLRKLDHPRFIGIAVAPLPMQGLGAAINDRLTRAAFRP